MPALKTIDLFAGAGGLSLGFERAGFEIVAGVERDPDAAATYRSAHPDAKLHEEDIATINFGQYRHRVDVVVGGPPCQPWSLGGLRKGHQDGRDGIPQFARAVHQVQPQAFVMENVAGLVRGAARQAFETVVGCLAGQLPLSSLVTGLSGTTERLDYHVTWRVLSAQDLGVPQNRLRLFVVGVREDATFEWPSPTHGPGHARPWRRAGEVLGPDAIGEPNPSIVTYARKPSIRPDPYHGQVYNGGGRPIDLTKPAPTLLASMGGNKTPWVDTQRVVPTYHAHLSHGGEPRTGRVPGARRITVDEAALLQTFPVGMGFAGSRSSRYRQVGNAVPVRLAACVADRLADILS